MAITTRMSDNLDLNLSLGSGLPDAGLVYDIPHIYSSFATVDSETGVITPISPGSVVVRVRRLDNGLLVRRVVVLILSNDQYAYNGTVPSNVDLELPNGFVPIDQSAADARYAQLSGAEFAGAIGSTRPSALHSVLMGTVYGEANNRFNIQADGGMSFGPGTAANDAWFSRNGVGGFSMTGGGGLTIDAFLSTARPSAGDPGYFSRVIGDTVDRFIVLADGRIQWGPGNAAPDISLYRNGAGVLKTDGDLIVAGSLTVNGTTATVNSTVVNVADKLVHYNHPSANGSDDPVPTTYSGFSVHRGTVASVERSHAGFVWDEAAQKFKTSFMTDDTTLGAALDLSVAGLDATSVVVSGTSSFAGTMSFSTTGSIAITAASAVAASRMTMKVTGDATSRWQMLGDGKMEWGAGAAALDTNLYRSAADNLKTDDAFTCLSLITSSGSILSNRSTTTLGCFFAQVTGDTVSRLGILADGKIEWGAGSIAKDTNLYRSAADTLKTDDAFIATSGTFSNVFIGNLNGTSTDAGLSTKTSTKALALEGYNGVRGKHNCYFDGSNILFMSAATAARFDLTGSSFTIGFSTNTPTVNGVATIATRLTLSTAGLLTLGDGLVATTGTLSGQWSWTRSLVTDYFLAAKVTGDSLSRFAAKADGTLEWGDGGATGRDTKLYRSEPYGLKTDGGFRAGGWRTSTLGNTANKWCQVLKITLSNQYDVASGTLKIIRAGNNGSTTGLSAVADVYFRFKQQGTMASSPEAELVMPFGMGLDPSDFKLVVTTDNGTTKEAYLYVRQTASWDSFKYNLLAEASWPVNAITMLNNVAFEDNLPGGVQYSCVGGVLVDDATGSLSLMGDLTLATAGKLLKVKGGANSVVGTATLVAGTVTVSNTLVAAGDMIVLTVSGANGTQGFLSYTISAGTSFTINSSSSADTSTVKWIVVRQV